MSGRRAADRPRRDHRFLGIVVPSAYAQSEGVESVLASLQRVGATAVCLTTTVLRERTDGGGARMPDLHRDGWQRVLERPLFGRQDLHVSTHAGYVSDPGLYAGTGYGPPPPVTAEVPAPDAAQQLARHASAAGLEVFLHVQPTVPPGLAQPDAPVLIDGTSPSAADRASPAGCPNNPRVRAYGHALIADSLAGFAGQEQPTGIDGLLVDWAEFPAYQLSEVFTCFCEHCRAAAGRLGFDWDVMVGAARVVWDWCHDLDPVDLRRAMAVLDGPFGLVGLLGQHPGWLELIRFKALCVSELLLSLRTRAHEVAGEQLVVAARGWPPPWNLSSGMDYALLAGGCPMVAPKLFTFDFAALPRWYGEQLCEWSPRLDESDVLDAMVRLMELPDDLVPRRMDKYLMPAPGETHHTPPEAHRTRLQQLVRAVGDAPTRLCPIVHAYLPTDEWRRMLRVARSVDIDGVWVQMYGYLTEEKLDVLAEEWTR